MKTFLKEIRETLNEAVRSFFRDILAPLFFTVIISHYLGNIAGVIALAASASIWSAWLTVLEAPGESIRWKLKWFKNPPSQYVVEKTARKAVRIVMLIGTAMILDRVF